MDTSILTPFRRRYREPGWRYIQRSRGYTLRPSVTVAEIARVVELVKKASPDTIVMVDNCYGEFVERQEPTRGGGRSDHRVAHQEPRAAALPAPAATSRAGPDLVELCAHRLTAPGVGKEVGCTLGESREHVHRPVPGAYGGGCGSQDSGAHLGRYRQNLGYAVYSPLGREAHRHHPGRHPGRRQASLVAFCQGVQKGAPVDAYVTPEPWDMPGYDSQVIMAAGAFTMGASIELSGRCPHAGALCRLDAGRPHLSLGQGRPQTRPPVHAGAGRAQAVMERKIMSGCFVPVLFAGVFLLGLWKGLSRGL